MKITPFQLERFFAKYEFKAPYLLCTSDCESMIVQELLTLEEGSLDGLKSLHLGYTESEGSPELRFEIAKLYESINISDILVHSGAEEGVFTFMNAALNPGDHVIVHFPCYQSLFEIAASIGCDVTIWRTEEENNWELDKDFLRQNIRKSTKAIIINLPHNPTGYLAGSDKFLQIIDIAREHNLMVFSDEVYRFLEYKEEYRLPAACDIYENAVSLGVMSKTFGLAGLRIGWIATKNNLLLKKIAEIKDYTTICSSAPSEFLSILALKNKESIIKRNLDIVLKNIDILKSFFNKYENLFNWIEPKAGSIAFPSLKIDIDTEAFCIGLVEKKGVLLLPGSYYGYGNKNFRIGFGRKNLPECVERLDDYITHEFKDKM